MMSISDLMKKINYYKKKGCTLELDNTLVIATRKTKRGIETAGINDFIYDPELDMWCIEVTDWEKEEPYLAVGPKN